MTLHNALRCAKIETHKNVQFLGHQTQESNSKEHEDKIQVYPSVTLLCDKCWYEGDTMHGAVLFYEPTLIIPLYGMRIQ